MTTPFTKRFSRAADEVEAFLRKQCANVTPLPAGDFPQGWSVEAEIAGDPVALQVLLPRDFPSAPPRIRVTPAEKYHLHIPHVESDGLLCLYPSGVEFNTEDPAGGIEPTWARARGLLEKPNLADFFEEFPSYWRLNIGPRREALSLYAGDTPKSSYGLLNGTTLVVGDTEASLRQWWKNHQGESKAMPTFTPVHRLDLAKPLYPFEFPQNLADFLDLARGQDAALAVQFFRHVAEGTRAGLVVVCIPTPGGHVEGVVELPALDLSHRKVVQKGFRPGRVPLPLVQSRGQAILRQTKLARYTIQPVVHRYIHSRGGNGTDLAGKSVIVIGCGSLGGYVAHLFAKAGVGRLTLIDPEMLTWDNAGRHILGGRFVGCSKAKSLAHILRMELPHLKVEAFAAPWREVHDHQSLAFSTSDLIVSTVGSWNAEHDLNVLLRKGDLAAAGLFTWIEPHAVAGHAMLVHPTEGGCMQCSMDPWGTFAERTCDPAPMTKVVAGCAGSYQPYGVAEMIPIASLAVQTGVDFLTNQVETSERRSWLGPDALFRQHGLTVLSPWAEKLALQPYGSIHHEALAPATGCRCCN